MPPLRASGYDESRPFVGRESELDRILDAANGALSGDGRVVLIHGEAGIGKTSLAVRALSRLENREVGVAIGRCFESSNNSPYFPWISAVQSLSNGVAPISTGMFEADGDDIATSEALFARMTSFMREHTAEQPVAILLDDIHWSDLASLEFLRHLATQIYDMSLLILCTYRDDELQRDDHLYTLLPPLVREGPTTRVPLRKLDRSALSEWVDSHYELQPDDRHRLVDYLQHRSDGNPFFASELLRSLEDHRALTRDTDNRWHLDDLDAVGVPTLLQQVLESRLQTVSPEAREILSVASVIGQHVPIDLLDEVTASAPDTLAAAIDDALEAHLLRAVSEAAVQFEHVLTRDTLYEQIGTMRRRRLHISVAEALIERAPDNADAIVYHFERAGDRREIEWLINAGDRAFRALARLTAAEKFDRALSLIGTAAERREQRAWLLFRLAEARRLSDPRQALDHLDEAMHLAKDLGDEPLTAMIRFSRGMVFCLLDHPQGLDELLSGDRALDDLSDADRWRIFDEVRIDVRGRKGDLATWLASFGRYKLAIEVANKYLEEVTRADRPSQRTVPDAWDALGVSHAALGQPTEATVALRRSVELFDDQGNFYSAGVSTWEELLNVGLIYHVDDTERRERTAATARDYFRQSRNAQVELHPDWPFVPLYFIEGEWDRAYQSAEATLQTDAWSVGPLFWLGAIEAARGARERARERVFSGLPAGYESKPGSSLIFNALRLLHLGGTLALADGNHEEAAAWEHAIGDWLAWSGRVIGKADHFVLRARIAHVRGDIDRALAEIGLAVEHAHRPRQSLSLIAALREQSHLLIESGDLSAADASLRDAEELAEACSALYSLGRTLLVRIELELQRGQYVAVRPALGRARDVLSRLQATEALAIFHDLERKFKAAAAPDTVPGGLTDRELEVLVLVTRGLTDSEVAQQLNISRRTVSNHLGSIYSKLGVSSRAAATRFAIENDLA